MYSKAFRSIKKTAIPLCNSVHEQEWVRSETTIHSSIAIVNFSVSKNVLETSVYLISKSNQKGSVLDKNLGIFALNNTRSTFINPYIVLSSGGMYIHMGRYSQSRLE